MYIMINKVYNHIHEYINVLIVLCFDWSGKNGNKSVKSQGKVREF